MKIKNLAILEGKNTTIKDGTITYLPTFKEPNKSDEDGKEKEPESAEIRTDYLFSQGSITYKIKAENPIAGVLITHDSKDGKHLFSAGLSYGLESFRIYDAKTGKQDKNGSLANFKKNEELVIRYEIKGSEAKLYVNNVLYCELNTIPFLSPLSFRITSDGKVQVYDIEVNSVQPKLFVVMQFTEEYNNLYKEVIIPVAEKKGLEVIRADEFYSSTPILNDIIRSIKESSIIIAEITPDNPNVFYEIGYAHAINKPTILICDRKREKLPFDISSFRTLFYDNTISGKSKIEQSLKKYLENILENGI